MIVSKPSSKALTTIAQPVRSDLHLKEGDSIAYHIEGERVVIARVSTEATEDPLATFSEWANDTDKRAYGHL